MTTRQTSAGSRRRPRLSIEDRLYHLLSDHAYGNDNPPGTRARFEFKHGSWPEIATTYNDDGALMWIGTGSEWHTNFNQKDARRLAWFILWNWWAKGQWFGLRRWAWYKLLHRRIARWRAFTPTEDPHD